MNLTWTDAANILLQLVTAYYATRNHQKIGNLHKCVDNAKAVSNFHTDIMVDLLKDIKTAVDRQK